MRQALTVERFYPHPPAAVWRALTDPELLARWLMPNDIAPIVGHEFTFTTTPRPGFDGIVHCTVLAADVERRLVISWRSSSGLDAAAGLARAIRPAVAGRTEFPGGRRWRARGRRAGR